MSSVKCPKCGQGNIHHAGEFFYGHPLDAVRCAICGFMTYRADTVKPEIPPIDSYQWKSSASRQRVVEAARGNGKKRPSVSALRAANERIKDQITSGGLL